MTTLSEMIARLAIYEELGSLPSLSIHPETPGYSTGRLFGDAKDATVLLRTLAAERDAAYAAGAEAMREAARQAVVNERVTPDPTPDPTDISYNAACGHCAEAIRTLLIPPQETKS